MEHENINNFIAERMRSADNLLIEFIRNRHANMLQVTRARLNNLFLESGFLLKEIPDDLLKEVARLLQRSYGVFFSRDELYKMKQLALGLTNIDEAQLLIDILSLEQLLKLVALEDKKSKLNFIRQVTKTDITESIRTNQKKDHSRVLSDADYLKAVREIKTRFAIQLQFHPTEAFQKPFFVMLRPLLDIRESLSQNGIDGVQTQSLSAPEASYRAISQLVNLFRQKNNIWLNSFLNYSFYEIGIYLNELCSQARFSVNLSEVSEILVNIFGNHFDQDNLEVCRRFATYWRKNEETLELVSLVSWPYLRILPLDNIEACLFYARLAAEQDWSVETLLLQIKEGINEQITKTNDQGRVGLKTSAFTTATITQKEGNHIETINTMSLQIPISPIALRILDNPYFPLISS